jgi:hypothetical protein
VLHDEAGANLANRYTLTIGDVEAAWRVGVLSQSASSRKS